MHDDTPPLAPRPTRYGPGTAGKVRMMERRIAAGWQARHPGDAPMDGYDLARVPRLERRNHKVIGWRVLVETRWRATGPRFLWDGEEDSDDWAWGD